MFHTGTTKAGGHSLLCVANKRRIIIYEFTKIKGVSYLIAWWRSRNLWIEISKKFCLGSILL